MADWSVRVVGDEEMRDAVRKLGPRWADVAREVTLETALDIETDYKRDVPANFGRLRTAIRTRFAARGLVADVGVFEDARVGGQQVNYAPYVEDGTRAAAGRAKGKMPPIEPLRLWAARKLGDADAAFAIARKIQQEGTEPQPALGPAYEKHAPTYEPRLKRALRDALP